MIKIRQATYEDIPRIMKHIDEDWKKGHIMGNDRKMFEFQHVRNGEVFYIIAEDDTTGKIYASMGYMPMAEGDGACMSSMMIRALKNPEERMLGEEMARFFEANMGCRNLISPGIMKRYAKALAALSDNVGMMEHYYRLGKRESFVVARINHYERPDIKKTGVVLEPLETAEQFRSNVDLDEIAKDCPRRSMNYIEHRYYEHPYFSYRVYGLRLNGQLKSAIVMREENVSGAKVLRIVDFFGRDEDLAFAGESFDQLIEEGDYEYIDFYCYGIEGTILRDAGFVRREEKDTNIIPNYFAPFVQENIEIFFYTWHKDKIHVYRGFGDQDRPNHVI
ncbi:MAG: hypothetical protein J1F02_05115 [Lachnospiraceae bacterium]|nr:hypothetical protein [Lachnospiraceae bacterium]